MNILTDDFPFMSDQFLDTHDSIFAGFSAEEIFNQELIFY